MSLSTLIKTFIALVFINFSIASYATNEYKNNNYNVRYNSIHKITLQHDPNKGCFEIYLSTKLGYLQADGSCQYQEETDRSQNPFMVCFAEEKTKLDGDKLSEIVPPGYTCAATHASGSMGEDIGLDEYQIFSDGGKYISTTAEKGSIYIP
jgi:hypothetical protein